MASTWIDEQRIVLAEKEQQLAELKARITPKQVDQPDTGVASSTTPENRWRFGALTAKSKYQFPLRDLLILPAVVGVLLVTDGAEAFREGIPLVFAIWVAVRQHHLTTITLVNPITVGMVTGSICYVLFEFADAKNDAIGHILMSAGLGALYGILGGVIACMYVVMALLVWESCVKAPADGQQ